MSYTGLKVLLDSTYILPSFGIEVEGLLDGHIKELREAALRGKVSFYCLPLVWVEIIGKVYRESLRLGLEVKEIVEDAVRSLLISGFYRWIMPSSDAVALAFKLRALGHKDNIDNLLYATSVTNGMIFLTIDENLRSFLANKGFKTDHVMDHVKLLSKIR